MMKQTMICLLSIAATALAALAADLDLAGVQQRLASPDYEVRKAVVTELFHIGETRPLRREEIDLLLKPFKSDADWRIKVRIAWVLTLAADKTQVLQPLMTALQERDDNASGGGNLQIASCHALALIGDKTALPAMRQWLTFLKSNPDQFKLLRDTLLKNTKAHIKELEDKPNNEGSNTPSQGMPRPARQP